MTLDERLPQWLFSYGLFYDLAKIQDVRISFNRVENVWLAGQRHQSFYKAVKLWKYVASGYWYVFGLTQPEYQLTRPVKIFLQ